MGSFACALTGIIGPNRPHEHSPPLLADREDQASRLGQERPAGRIKQRRRLKMGLKLVISSIVIMAGYPIPLLQEYQVCHLFHQYLVDPEKRKEKKNQSMKEDTGFIWHISLTTNCACVCVFTHVLSFFANCSLWALDASATLQEKHTLRNFAMHIRTTVPIAVLRNISSDFFFPAPLLLPINLK